MGKRKNNRNRNGRARGGQSAGNITLQYSVADNVDQYTTINITTASLLVPTDRPVRIRWVRVQFSCVPDSAAVKTNAHTPIVQFNVCAPSGGSDPRYIYRSPPFLVPLGPVNTRYFKIPNAGFFMYDSAKTICLQMIVSGSSGLAVTANYFVNILLDFKSYQGLDGVDAPMCTVTH